MGKKINNPINTPNNVTSSYIDSPAFKKIQQNKQQNQLNASLGYKTYRVQRGPDLIVRDPNYDAIMFSKFLSHGNGYHDYGTQKDLYAKVAGRQSNTKAFLLANPMNVYAMSRLVGIEAIRQIGQLGELPSVLNGTSDFKNSLTVWAEEQKDLMRSKGELALTNSPDKMVGDFKGYLDFMQNTQVSTGVSMTFGLMSGGAMSVIGKGASTATWVAKTAQIGGAFFMTLSESVDQGAQAYHTTIADYMQQINPATGKFYTKEEVDLLAHNAAKTSFYLNQTFGTVLNVIGLDGLIAPELKMGKEITNIIKKSAPKTITAKGLSKSADALKLGDDVLNIASKKASKMQWGIKTTLASATSEGIEEIFNNYATNIGVASQTQDAINNRGKGDILGYNPLDVFAKTTWSKEGLWSFIGGFAGGAGAHLLLGSSVGHKMKVGIDYLRGNNINVLSSNGRQIYTTDKKTDISKFIAPSKYTSDKITTLAYEDNQKLTVSKPKKIDKKTATAAQIKKYNEDLQLYKDAAISQFKQTKRQMLEDAYIDSYLQRGVLVQNMYAGMARHLNIIESNIKLKEAGEQYNKEALDRAYYNLTNVSTYFHLMNNSEGNLLNTLEELHNIDKEQMIKMGFKTKQEQQKFKTRGR